MSKYDKPIPCAPLTADEREISAVLREVPESRNNKIRAFVDAFKFKDVEATTKTGPPVVVNVTVVMAVVDAWE